MFENAIKFFDKLILNELASNNIKCWVAGGAVRDYMMGLSPKTDYDLFFPNLKEYERARFYFIDNNSRILWDSENGTKVEYKNKTFDLIKKAYFNNPEETIQAFDFTVSMFAVDRKSLYHGERSFVDLAKRQLMINQITYPASTLKRALKYTSKGFKICNNELYKIITSIQNDKTLIKVETQEQTQTEETTSLNDFFIGID